jgi:hypothetical protein
VSRPARTQETSNFQAQLKTKILIRTVYKTITPEGCYSYISELAYSTMNNYLPNTPGDYESLLFLVIIKRSFLLPEFTDL